MPISRHFRDCKALLLTSLTHASSAISSILYLLPLTKHFHMFCICFVFDFAYNDFPKNFMLKSFAKILNENFSTIAHADNVTPAAEVASRHRLRYAKQHRLIVPRCRLNTYGRPRAFPVAGPTVWNTLPDELRDQPCNFHSFTVL